MENLLNISILIIEDEQEASEQYEKMLKKFVKNIYIANDGLEGISLYNKYNPDIIISDITMPYLSGLDLVKKIRETDSKTKIILLTAYSEQEKLLDAIKLNLESYLIKPVDREELKKVIYDISSKLESNSIIKLIDGYSWDNLNNILLDKVNKQVKLTKNELVILKLLGSKPEEFFSLEQILDFVYNDNKKSKEDDSGRLRTTISRLKNKLSSEIVESVYGFGYRLNLK